MAEVENKNQHTLYRIVSLRNPEKFNKKKQPINFVLFDLKLKSKFLQAVISKPATQTKWQALKAVTFSPFTTESEIENINSTFFEVADWLAKNRKQVKAEVLIEKIVNLSPLNEVIEANLWDNLFYKVITDKNYYLKELIMQILVMQNLLKQVSILTPQNLVLENISALADAVVILPTELFEEEVTNNQPTVLKKANKEFIIPKALNIAQEVAKARIELERLEETKKELKKFETKQNSLFQKQYSEEQKKYQKTIKPTLDKYNADYSKAKFDLELLADKDKTTANLNLINIPYPELPDFEYESPTQIEQKNIQSKVSENSFEILDNIVKWDEVESYKEIYQNIENLKAIASKKIVENTIFSTQYASFGDMIFPISKGNSEINLAFRFCFTKIFNSANHSTIFAIIFSNSPLDVIGLTYILELQDGTTLPLNNIFTSSVSGNVTTITNLFSSNGLLIIDTNPPKKLTLKIKFSDNSQFSYNIENIVHDIKTDSYCTGGKLTGTPIIENQDDFAPKGFGFRQLGIADYKKVVTEICGYRAGEVAHIENILAGETREKVTTKTHTSEVTQTDTTEIETENISDSTSTSRFEMQTEIAKMQLEQKQFDAHANVHASYGVVTLDAGANYATNTTKEESNRQAVTQAKEQTQRAMERIVSKIKSEKAVKITDTFIEENSHRFENVTNPDNVSGVYRFVNAVYKNQIFNYGKRLMYEFMIPQPSKLHRLGLQASTNNKDITILKKPEDPRLLDILPTLKTEYLTLAGKYKANVKILPKDEVYVGTSFEFFNLEANKGDSKTATINIPKDYVSVKANANFTGMNSIGAWESRILVSVGNASFNAVPSRVDTRGDIDVDSYVEKIPVTFAVTGYHTANVTVNVLCKLSDDAIEAWQNETYLAIIKGYEDQLEAFNNQQTAIKAEGIKILDSNPLFYRQTEQLILRKNCISYLIDNNDTSSNRRMGLPMYNYSDDLAFDDFQVNVSQTMDEYTSFAKFMEQAFEWNLMSYNFYPFYWGNSIEWKDLYQFETNDPTYRAFMQSGMARVVVTVKPGFEDAIMHFMAFGQIWNGGQTPILGNPLYLSIVEELKEQEYLVEETWETTVPTNLVALQEKGVSIAGGGLPNAPECLEHADKNIKENSSNLVPKK